jgi:FkbM family methyltransferase
LIEANPFTYKMLKARDRKCSTVNACVSDTLPSMTFVIAGGITSAKEAMSEKHRKRISKETKEDAVPWNSAPSWEGKGKEIKTACRTLESMLEEIGRTHVDYFSLDVEGAEMIVLQSLPWDKISIRYFSIEMDTNPEKITAFMKSKGYRIKTRLQIDAVFEKVH